MRASPGAFGDACGAVRCGSLRDGRAAGEAAAGLDLAARAGGACLVGPAVAVGYGLRPPRDCDALLGLGARRRTHFVPLRVTPFSQTRRVSLRSALRAPPPALRCSGGGRGPELTSFRCPSLRSDRRAESVYEVRCAHRPQPCAARRARCPAKASPSAPGGIVPAGRQIRGTLLWLRGGIDEPSRLRQCPRPAVTHAVGFDA